MRICVNTINGLENEYGGYGAARPGSARFRELMSALRQAQIAEGTGFRIRSDKDAPVVLMFARPANAQGAAATRRVRELLGLDMSRSELSVVYGSAAQNDAEIAVLTRSILQVMKDLASHIDVPASDIEQGRVYGVPRSADEEKMFPPLLAVRHGDAAPDDAFTSVRYRNQWFWIDDNDQASKHTLGFLLLMFALSEGATPAPAPVVTVPVR